MNASKPSYLTGEFWMHFLSQMIALATMVAAIFGHTFNGSHLQALVPAAAMAASAISASIYSASRSKVKVAALASGSNAVPTPPAPMPAQSPVVPDAGAVPVAY